MTTGNLLDRETSPYLLQHADNPVHWRAWGPDALAEAKAENKPILLSVGYAACHWCHVMAHESFENQHIAALMNDGFVNIKVDREERPDIDQIYQSALALTGQQGGWPLTMFLTPSGEPFWGGTYFPPDGRWGRPGFADVLRAVRATWTDEPDKIAKNVTALQEALSGLNRPESGEAIDADLLNKVAERLVREVDPDWGGVGGAPKFPQPYVYEMLWRGWRRTGRDGYRQAVEVSATKMCQGGIYDHVGGGFARYATDAQWLAPHFEKMLYDNAQLIDLLTLLWQGTARPLYRVRVAETVDWVLREMIAESGAFAATLDADSEGEEGKFYVWTEAEIDAVLGTDADLFKHHYDVRPGGNWEGKTILNRRHADALSDEATERTLARCRARLFDEREKRVRPGWDDKVLADWNGLMIAAMANAALVFDQPAWIDAAALAHDTVIDQMVVDGRLTHSLRHGQARHDGTLDDHANMARGALALHEATGDPRFLESAKSLVSLADEHYWDTRDGGYFFTADDAEGLIQRIKNAHDNAVPSGNGTMVGVLSDLFLLTGDAGYRDRAEATVRAFSGEVSRNFFPLMTLFNKAERLAAAEQIVIVGPRGEGATRALVGAVLARDDPNRLMTVIAPDEALPEGHPAAGKGLVDGQPAAYVCRGLACQAPVTDAGALAGLLEEV